MNSKLSRFPVGILGSLASSVITVSYKPAYNVVKDNVLLHHLETIYSEFFGVFGKKTFSGMGSTIEEADIYRDEPFRGIKSVLKGFTKVSDDPLRNEASLLLGIIEQLGSNIDKLNYAEENEKMDKLISEFDKPDNTGRLNKLHLSDMYATLKSRHADFKSLYFTQTEANASLRLQHSASELRSELSEALRNYLALVTAMKQVDGWKELYAELNELVKGSNRLTSTGEKQAPAPPAI